MNPTQMAAVTARIMLWTASGKRPGRSLRPTEIEMALKMPMRVLASCLVLLNWQRHIVWHVENNRRIRRVLWTPPGIQQQRPLRGRPSYQSILEEMI